MTPQDLHKLINTAMNESMERKYMKEGSGRYFEKELIPAHFFEDKVFLSALIKRVKAYLEFKSK